jgi:hypothetical protein
MRKPVVVLLTIAVLILAGCGPAVMPAESPETKAGEQFVIALPRLVLNFDENGVPGVEGLPIEQIARSVGYPLDLQAYRINPAYINWMTQSGIQHIELRPTGTGVALLINGKPMPHISFQDGALESSAGLVRLLGPQYEQMATLLQKLAPIVKRLGLSVVLKAPIKEGAQAIELAADEAALATPEPAEGPASAIMNFEITYDDQGVPSIMGISARDLASLGINAPLALHPYYIQQVQDNNIQYMQLRSKGDGLYIYLNGAPLPALAWDKGMLENTLDVAQQLYANVPIDWNLVKQFVPLLSNTDVSILMHLPKAPDAEALKVEAQ